jgi:U5 snRNP spliceosome subunit
MFKTVFAATAALVITAIPAQAQTCTRDGLKAIVANYFKAVETHNMSALETAPNLRITQNGSEIKLGEGFFKTGGKSQFQRTLIDTERCGTLTQAIIDETPDPNAPAPAGRGGGAAEPQVRAVRRPAEVQVEPQRLVRVPVKVGPVVRLQAREVVYLLRPLTPVPRSFLQCDLKSTKARSVKSKRSLTGRGNSSSAPRASSKRRIMIGKVFFRPHSAARANT